MKGLLVILLASTVASLEIAPLLQVNEPIPGRYIIKLKTGESTDDVIATLDNVNVLYKYKTVLSGFAAQLSDHMVLKLRESNAVEYIEEDGIARANAVSSWGLDRIDQTNRWLDNVFEPIGTGNGVDVYVLDTGINVNHNDFGTRSRISYDAFGGSGGDCNGHGTHCAGTVAGTDYGVAKRATVYGVRVLDCNGAGAWSGIIDGCEWVANNRNGPSVASMSLGGSASQSVDDAVQNMIDRGISVAVAAGNEQSTACYWSPSRLHSAITVGATDDTDTRASFSNFGECVDIFAPGVDITSAWYTSNSASYIMSGTSMACPHVAGAAAVLLGSNSGLSPFEVKQELQYKSTANKVSDTSGAPNLLLYIGEGSGGGSPPPPCQSLTSSSGSFTSPNYPSNYDNAIRCDYLITVGSGPITLTFDHFDIEYYTNCAWDSLTIYDGSSTNDRLVGKFCGTDNPGPLTSSGSSFYIVFSTDNMTTRKGFSASYVS